MKTDPNQPINACEIGYDNGHMLDEHQNGNYTSLYNGLTKREYFAAMAMQGLWANWKPNIGITIADVAFRSVESADALIEELNK